MFSTVHYFRCVSANIPQNRQTASVSSLALPTGSLARRWTRGDYRPAMTPLARSGANRRPRYGDGAHVSATRAAEKFLGQFVQASSI